MKVPIEQGTIKIKMKKKKIMSKSKFHQVKNIIHKQRLYKHTYICIISLVRYNVCVDDALMILAVETYVLCVT